MGEINVVPYIDVMLVLLVIFMVTAPLLHQGVTVELPQVGGEPVDGETPDPFTVTVDVEGRYYVNEDQSPRSIEEMGQMAAALMRQSPDTPVLVRGHGQVAYAEVVRAMVVLQEAGVPSVGLVTEPAPREGGGGG
jgi:biopolymer transport protein TolR